MIKQQVLRQFLYFLIDLLYIFCMGYLLYYFTINDVTYILNQKTQMCVECSDHHLATFHMFLYDIMFGIEFIAIVANIWIASLFIPSNKTLLFLLKVVIIFLVFQSKDIIATALIHNSFRMLLKCEIYGSIASLSIQILMKCFFIFKNEDSNDWL